MTHSASAGFGVKKFVPASASTQHNTRQAHHLSTVLNRKTFDKPVFLISSNNLLCILRLRQGAFYPQSAIKKTDPFGSVSPLALT
jgi:hypothetical protein